MDRTSRRSVFVDLLKLVHADCAVKKSRDDFELALIASMSLRNVLSARSLVSQTFASWNRIAGWLRQLAGLRGAA